MVNSFDVLFDLPIYVPVEADNEEQAEEIARETLLHTSDDQLAMILLDAVKLAKARVEKYL